MEKLKKEDIFYKKLTAVHKCPLQKKRIVSDSFWQKINQMADKALALIV